MIASLLFLGLTAQLGTNLNNLSDSSPQFPFSDAAKTARCYGTPATPFDCKAALGPDGFPSGDFGMVMMTDVPHDAGVYKLSFAGKADISLPGVSGSVSNVAYDVAKNLTTADVTLGKDSNLWVGLRNAIHVRDISLLRPNTDKSQTFNPAFLASIQHFKILRFMDWQKTNSSTLKTWADRKLVTELQTGPRGVAYEYIAELGNVSQKDIWINVPMQADEDYVKKMAELFKAKLDPKLNLYVELSNEVWNTAPPFQQSFQNHDAAVAEVAAGALDLKDGNPADTNDWYWARRRFAKKTVRVAQIFSDVFGADQLNKRVRVILGAHAADHSKARVELRYIQKNFPPVNKFIYGMCIAPYFASNAHTLPGATVDTVLDGLKSSIDSQKLNWARAMPWDGNSQNVTNHEYAKYYGIKIIAYEGGQHQQGAPMELNLAAMAHPRMATLMEEYLNNWFATSDGPFIHFSDVGKYDVNNFFGATNDLRIVTPRIEALKKVAIKVNGVQPDPVVIDPKDQIIADLRADIVKKEAGLKDLQSTLDLAKATVQKMNADLSACIDEKTQLRAYYDAVRAIVLP